LLHPTEVSYESVNLPLLDYHQKTNAYGGTRLRESFAQKKRDSIKKTIKFDFNDTR